MNPKRRPCWQVYSVTCKDTQRVYIGLSKNAARRFTQHASKPPRRMRLDVLRYVPFRRHFALHILYQTPEKVGAKRQETHLIQLYRSQGAGGYNTLPSQPATSRQFWAIRRSKARNT